MTQLITTNNQHVSNVTDVGITLLHLSPNVITLRSLLHLRAVITFRSSTNGTFITVGLGKFWSGLAGNLGSFCVMSRSLFRQVLFLSRSLGLFAQGLGYFCRASRNLGILPDQTAIYLKDIVFGH